MERRNVAIEKERLFVQNQLERRNLNLKIQKDRNHRLALYILSAAACLIFFLAYLYQRKLLKKERFIRQMREQMRLHQIALSEKEQLIRQNEEAIEQLSARQSEQEEIAEQQLNDQLSEIERIRQENELLNREKKQLQQEMARYAQNIPEKTLKWIRMSGWSYKTKRLQPARNNCLFRLSCNIKIWNVCTKEKSVICRI